MKKISEEYFNWLCNIVDDGAHMTAHKKVLACLYLVEFVPRLIMDNNRAYDGIDLRYDFAEDKNYHPAEINYYLDERPCSILEMMVALAQKCEDIMSDGEENRTPFWFWNMFETLGLMPYFNGIEDSNVLPILNAFNQGNYQPDGTGGLFYVPNFDGDLRTVEIWYQMQLYLKDKS